MNKLIVSDYTKWGMEAWQTGQSIFGIAIGNGKQKVYIVRIIGLASVSIQPKYYIDGSILRQTLISLFYSGSSDSGPVTKIKTPKGMNHSLDRNLFSVNIKQLGRDTVHVPIDVSFEPNVHIPKGELFTSMKIQSYDDSGLIPDAKDCLDVELHLTVFYEVL